MRVVATVTTGDLEAGFLAQLEQNKDEVDKLISQVADFVRDDAKRTASFIDRTGNLRRSIRKRKSKFIDGGYIVTASGRNRSDDKGFHAALIEFGHVKVLWGRRTNGRVAPRQFMRPALEKGRAYMISKVGGGR